MNYELRQYSFGETIGKGFNLFFNNFIPIFFLSLVCQAIQLSLTMYANSLHISQNMHPFRPIILIYLGVFIFLTIVLESILSAWVIHLVSKKFLEENSVVAENPKITFIPLILPIIGLSIVGGFLTILGTIALIIPGIIIGLGLLIAPAVLVVEKKGIKESLKRSWDLSKGEKGTIFGLLFVTNIIIACINWPLTALIGFLHFDPRVTIYLQQVVTALTSPVHSCIAVVIYFNLRIEKEAFNIEHLIGQFTLPEDREINLEG